MLKNYIKMALKVLLRRKVFTCISLVTISFTLMVLMVGTALFDHVFGSFPPETRADRTLVHEDDHRRTHRRSRQEDRAT